MAAAHLGEIVKANGQAHFVGLELLAAELADQAGGFAKDEGQGRFIIRLVIRQRGVAGNGRAVFDLQQQWLAPETVREEPELLSPDPEFLFEQMRWQFRDFTKRRRAERGQGALPVFTDAR